MTFGDMKFFAIFGLQGQITGPFWPATKNAIQKYCHVLIPSGCVKKQQRKISWRLQVTRRCTGTNGTKDDNVSLVLNLTSFLRGKLCYNKSSLYCRFTKLDELFS